MVEPIYALSTIIAVFMWGLTLRHAWGNTEHLAFLGTSTVYGWLLEKTAVVLFGIYSYPAESFGVHLWGVPISIPLAWGAILYSGLIAGKHIGLTDKYLPVFVGLFALHIDLAIDAIAIRIPYWLWHPSGLWFGVPIVNFIAWYSVPLLFTWIFLSLKDRVDNLVAVGAAALVGSSVILMIILEAWLQFVAPSNALQIILFVLIIFVSLVYLVKAEIQAELQLDRVPIETFVSILAIHLFYLGVVLYYGFYQDIPALLYISIAMILIGVSVHYIHRWPEIKEKLLNR